jgi:hypothetical protein
MSGFEGAIACGAGPFAIDANTYASDRGGREELSNDHSPARWRYSPRARAEVAGASADRPAIIAALDFLIAEI